MHKLSETETGWLLMLQGYRLKLESASPSLVSLSLKAKDDTTSYLLQIEASFTIHPARGTETTYQPNAELVRIEEFTKINEAAVRELVLSNTGTLAVRLESGDSLYVEGSTEYEPWNLSGSDGFRAVSTPNPSLSVWLPE